MRKTEISLRYIRELVTPVLEKHKINTAIVFGSFARGDATSSSDLDMVIDSGGALRGIEFFIVSDELSKILPLPVDVYEKREIKEGSVLHEEIKNEGVLIYER